MARCVKGHVFVSVIDMTSDDILEIILMGRVAHETDVKTLCCFRGVSRRWRDVVDACLRILYEYDVVDMLESMRICPRTCVPIRRLISYAAGRTWQQKDDPERRYRCGRCFIRVHNIGECTCTPRSRAIRIRNALVIPSLSLAVASATIWFVRN